MKILHIIFTKDFGGAERYTAELANLQANAGEDVRVLIRPQNKRPNIINILNKNVQMAKVHKLFQKWHVKKHIEIFEPDVIHCHLGKSSQVVSKIKPKIPTVATLHIDYTPKKYAKMNGLICLNTQQNPQAKGYTGKVVKIGAWVAPQGKISPKKLNALRQKLNINPHEKIIGSLCRLHQQKGLDILIKAFTEAHLSNTKLLIVGSGEEEANLKALAKNNPNIIFAPATNSPQLYYKLFDVFVSPSRAESMGLTILEAMVASLPIIATSTIGATQTLKNQPAILIPIEDKKALIKALKTTNCTSVKYNLAEFSPKFVLKQIEIFYKKLINLYK